MFSQLRLLNQQKSDGKYKSNKNTVKYTTFKNLSLKILQDIYRRFFIDFVTFGYSVELVRDILDFGFDHDDLEVKL